MNIYKLKYTDKETAIIDLIEKGVYKEVEIEGVKSFVFGDGIQAVVEIGIIVLENGTYDEKLELIKEPIYANGYHFDIMCEQNIDFENETFIKHPKHSFAI